MLINDLLFENEYQNENREKIKNLAQQVAKSISTDAFTIDVMFEGNEVRFIFDGDDIDTSEQPFVHGQAKEKFHDEFNYRVKMEIPEVF